MAIIDKIALENAQGVQVEYDIGSSAENVAYDSNDSIKDKIDTVAGNLSTLSSTVSTVSGNVSTLSGRVDTVSGNVSTLSSTVTTHTNSASASAAGAHGLRYYNDKLQTYDTTQPAWVDIPMGGGGHEILNSSGTEMTQRSKLQFADSTVTDDATNDKTIVKPNNILTTTVDPGEGSYLATNNILIVIEE